MNSSPSSNSWNGHFVGDNQRYRIERPLAAGGMGEVLLATDTRVGQQVVLKLLKDTLVASVEMRKRFEREIAVCAALQSDHIVKISDCGVTPEGFPFYVMEYLRGETLRQLLLREKRLSVERTVSIISQVCQGLQLAHQGVTVQKDGRNEHIQVIHRDLKPDNIFLVPTDLGEWVKILDFGVAKIRNESSELTNITSTFIGTFRYAAPEQLQNKRNLDARADIYSLGIILYEMFSAADPFGFNMKGNNISETSWVLAHAYEPPKPLRSQPGCEQLSAQLEDIILTCLHKNPNNRFASVEELNQALQAHSKPTLGNANRKYEPTILHTQPLSQPASNQETISKPLQPVELSQFDEETIIRQQPVYNPGANNETISRPLQPVEPSPPVYNPGGNNETIPRPLRPVEPEPPEGTIFQPRPSPHPVEPEPPDGTIFQPRPSPHPGGNNETISRPLQPVEPEPPDGTIFQPRPSPHPVEPEPPDGTIFQPRPSPHPEEPDQPDGTIFQPRPSPHPVEPDQPEGTIFQLKSKLAPQRNPNIVWRNLGIGLAIVLAFFLGMFIYHLQTVKGSKNLPILPNHTQK
jgi:serine/threonine protein kinase